MSATDEAPEDSVDTENVGGLGEIVPEPLEPAWRYVERFQAFRDTHGETYTKALEAIVAVVLTAGYLYWATLYL
ncbi:hypothetical protein [Halorussus marinus]|uniref:hypothetical protein n=1 Tax=Halorussus marinus TaxID=2505976 RepID=UPI00106E7225|nr:hypothetical protein [Halorussus marinus]